MRPNWQPSNQKLGGHSCIELPNNNSSDVECSIFGEYGEIWQASSEEYKVVIRSTRIARRYLDEKQWPREAGDEVVIRIPASELSDWVERLRVPAKASSQAKLANQIQKTVGIRSNIDDLGAPIQSSQPCIELSLGIRPLTPSAGFDTKQPPGSDNSNKSLICDDDWASKGAL